MVIDRVVVYVENSNTGHRYRLARAYPEPTIGLRGSVAPPLNVTPCECELPQGVPEEKSEHAFGVATTALPEFVSLS